ncbi:unnamed protein product [Sphagnum balticum]
MAAEGRSSETQVLQPALTSTSRMTTRKSNKESSESHVLSVRPPTTGASGISGGNMGVGISGDESSLSSDEELAEADQICGSEVNVDHDENMQTLNSSSVNNINSSLITNNVSASVSMQECQRTVNEEAVNGNIDEEEDEEDVETILGRNVNESGIRLSGDGEQGL